MRRLGFSYEVELPFRETILAVGPRRVKRDGVLLDLVAERAAASLGDSGTEMMLDRIAGIRKAMAVVPGLSSADLSVATWLGARPTWPYSTILKSISRVVPDPEESLKALRAVEGENLIDDVGEMPGLVSDQAWLRFFHEGLRSFLEELVSDHVMSSNLSLCALRVAPRARLVDLIGILTRALRGLPAAPSSMSGMGCRFLDIGTGVLYAREMRLDERPVCSTANVILEELAEAGYSPEAIAACAVMISPARLNVYLAGIFPGWPLDMEEGDYQPAYRAAWACPLPCCDSPEWSQNEKLSPPNQTLDYLPLGETKMRTVRSPFLTRGRE